MLDGPRIYNHGKLPHIDAPGELQFITFRLADSLPGSVSIVHSRRSGNATTGEFQDVDTDLDAGRGMCILREYRHAEIVRDAIIHRHGRVYDLHAWVVMPNHVHLFIRQHQDAGLGVIIKSLKTYTANRLNEARNTAGRVWQSGYFDKLVTNERQRVAVINYIHQNPVKAGLVLAPENWQFSSYVREFPVNG